MRGIETWVDVASSVPDEARPHLLDFEWDVDLLRALPLAVDALPVEELARCLAAPLWRLDGRPFSLRPLDVLDDPDAYREQYERTLAADLRYPLDVTWADGHWIVLDGTHRLLKAVLTGLAEIGVRKVPACALARIAAR